MFHCKDANVTASPSPIATAPDRFGLAEVAAGIANGLGALPSIIVTGLVAFAPVGPDATGASIIAAFLATVLAGAVVSAFAGTRGLIGAPSSTLAIVVAGVLAVLVHRGIVPTGAQGIGPALAISMLLVLATGALQAAAAALGVGRLVPLVPYPVLAGIRNGSALLLVLQAAQTASADPGALLPPLQPIALLVAAVTVLAMLWPVPGLSAVPRIIVALIAGTAAHHLAAALAGDAASVGPMMVDIPTGTRHLGNVAAGVAALPGLRLMELADLLLPAALSMTVLAVLETGTTSSTLQDASGQRGGGSRDLMVVALTNVVSGLCGALACTASLSDSIDSWRAGRHRRAQAAVRSIVVLLLALLATPAIALVPRAVMAGVILVGALGLADPDIVRLVGTAARARPYHRIEIAGNLVIMATVAGVAIVFGLVAAVAAGAVLSLGVFATLMAQGPVRRSYRNPLGRWRTRYPDEHARLLLLHGAAIEVVELQGAIFFGSSDQVAAHIERVLKRGTEYVILDLRRVNRIDLSGARGLLRTCERLWQAGHWVMLAAVRPGLPVWDYLDDLGLADRLPPIRVFARLEDAVAEAEATLLARHLGEVAEDGYSAAEGLRKLGLPPDAVAALLPRASLLSFEPGEQVIRGGDNSTSVFLLLEGRLDVTLPVAASAGEDAGRTRVATFTAGTLVGEMALVSGAPRSADVVARTPARCLCLELEALKQLRLDDPEAAWQLLRVIAGQIERNLRMVNAAIISYEE
jgi:SulP family sulfate permease